MSGFSRKCLSKVLGAAGAAFMAFLASAENVETYLFGPALAWMLGGSILAGCWAYEVYCRNREGEDDET
jgi:hypothetical protein